MSDIIFKAYAAVLAVTIVLGNLYVFGFPWGFLGAVITTYIYVFAFEWMAAKFWAWVRS
jgi:hypothetical protein